MIDQSAKSIVYAAVFRDITTGLPKSGLTVTVSILRVRTDELVLTGAAATESVRSQFAGLYRYIMPSQYDTTSDLYVVRFHTASTTVLQQDLDADMLLGLDWVQKALLIGANGVEVHSRIPISNIIELIIGADYTVGSADGPIDFIDTNNVWPTLTGATIVFAEGAVSVNATILVATGNNKSVRVELTHTDTAKFKSTGQHRYSLMATFPNGTVTPLARGYLSPQKPNT